MSKQKYITFRYERKPLPNHTRQSMATIDHLQAITIKMLYEKHGQVSIEDIVTVAGKKKQMYYFHFKDIRGAMEQLNEAVIGELREHLRGGRFIGTADETNRTVLMVGFDMMRQRSEVFNQLCLHDHQPELMHNMLEILYRHIRFPKDLLSQKPGTNDPQVEMLLCRMVCVFRRWSVETGCDIKRIAPYMKELLALIAETEWKLR